MTQPARLGPFQIRLKFGKQADVAKKLRELAD